LLRFV
jgi:hypothetical protein